MDIYTLCSTACSAILSVSGPVFGHLFFYPEKELGLFFLWETFKWNLLDSFQKRISANMEGYMQNVGPQLRELLNWPRPLPIEEERVRLLHEVIFCNANALLLRLIFQLEKWLMLMFLEYYHSSTFTRQPSSVMIILVIHFHTPCCCWLFGLLLTCCYCHFILAWVYFYKVSSSTRITFFS